ncbi:MAG: hypothetical protein RLZZ612_252 [Pseudomonadota bacterium]|jgi:nitrite reductase/ring-hydroxylating ferredoxin subunit
MDINDTWIWLCKSRDLLERGAAIAFDVAYAGRLMRAFAIRFEGQACAYLNECTHVPMEMDWQPNQFWDHQKRWLLCATHGAAYQPNTGQCVMGPCKRGLKKIDLKDDGENVFWRTQYNLNPAEF